MIPLQVFQRLLKKWTEKTTCVPWYFRDEAQGMWQTYPFGTISGPDNIRAEGQDSKIKSVDSAGFVTYSLQGTRFGDVTFQMCGRRQDAGSRMHAPMEKLRTSLALPSVYEAFNALGFAAFNHTSSQVLDMSAPYSSKDHIDSIVSLKVSFRFPLDVFEDTAGRTGRIEAVEFASAQLGIPLTEVNLDSFSEEP